MIDTQPIHKRDEPPHVPYYNLTDEQQRLLGILERFYTLMLKAINALIVAHFDLNPDEFIVDDNTTRRILQLAATRVVRIDETTRLGIAKMLQEGQARGYSNWQLAHGVPEDGYAGINGLFRETWKSRAETVARTELMQAQRDAAVQRYLATGMVDRVKIVDGCQWDKPCCERNGKIVPIERAPTLNHPNCTLLLVPLLREGIRQPPPPTAEPAEQPALL
jgi:hypothetical protein